MEKTTHNYLAISRSGARSILCFKKRPTRTQVKSLEESGISLWVHLTPKEEKNYARLERRTVPA